MALQEFQQETAGPSGHVATESPIGAALAQGAQSLTQPIVNSVIHSDTAAASLAGHVAGLNGIAPGMNITAPINNIESAYARSYMNGLSMQTQHAWASHSSVALGQISASATRAQEYTAQLGNLAKQQQENLQHTSGFLPPEMQSLMESQATLNLEGFKAEGINLVAKQNLTNRKFQGLLSAQNEYNQAYQIGQTGNLATAGHASDLFNLKIKNLVNLNAMSPSEGAKKVEAYGQAIKHGAFVQSFTNAAPGKRQTILNQAKSNASTGDAKWYIRQAYYIERNQQQLDKANFEVVKQAHTQNINQALMHPTSSKVEASHQQVLASLNPDSPYYKQVNTEYAQAQAVGNQIQTAHDSYAANLLTVREDLKNNPGTTPSQIKINKMGLAQVNRLVNLEKNDPAQYIRTSNAYQSNFGNTASEMAVHRIFADPSLNPTAYSSAIQLQCQHTLGSARSLVSPKNWQCVSNNQARSVVSNVMPKLLSSDAAVQQAGLNQLDNWKNAYGQYGYFAVQRWTKEGLDPAVGLAMEYYPANAALMPQLADMLANKKELAANFKSKLAEDSLNLGQKLTSAQFTAGIATQLSTYDQSLSAVAGATEPISDTLKGVTEYAQYLYTKGGLTAPEAQNQAVKKLVLDNYAYLTPTLRIPNRYKDSMPDIITSVIPTMKRDALAALAQGDVKTEYSLNAPIASQDLTQAQLADQMHVVSANDDTLEVVDAGGQPVLFKNKKGQWNTSELSLADAASYQPSYIKPGAMEFLAKRFEAGRRSAREISPFSGEYNPVYKKAGLGSFLAEHAAEGRKSGEELI
ncbi:MAG: hypothetical protein KAI17_03315 [Thiotrichaceae bacterium]|nr:hypothetical protein [Thiotrichaceae bacterium]